MKSRLIVNPTSGTDTGAEHLLTLNEQLRERVGAMDIVTVAAGDAESAAAEAALEPDMTLYLSAVGMEH